MLTEAEKQKLNQQFTNGLARPVAVFIANDLPMLIEQNLKDGRLQPTGEKLLHAPVYLFHPPDTPVNVRACCFSPEPDLLISAGSVKLLKLMARTGDGTIPGLFDGEMGSDIQDYFTDAQIWSIQSLSMFGDSAIRLSKAGSTTSDHDLQEKQAAYSKMPQATATQTFCTNTEMILRSEFVFENEAAANAYAAQLEKSVKKKRTNYEDTPEEVREFQDRLSQRTAPRVEKNRYVSEKVMNLSDFQEFQLLRNRFKEYYDKLEKRTREGGSTQSKGKR